MHGFIGFVSAFTQNADAINDSIDILQAAVPLFGIRHFFKTNLPGCAVVCSFFQAFFNALGVPATDNYLIVLF